MVSLLGMLVALVSRKACSASVAARVQATSVGVEVALVIKDEVAVCASVLTCRAECVVVVVVVIFGIGTVTALRAVAEIGRAVVGIVAAIITIAGQRARAIAVCG